MVYFINLYDHFTINIFINTAVSSCYISRETVCQFKRTPIELSERDSQFEWVLQGKLRGNCGQCRGYSILAAAAGRRAKTVMAVAENSKNYILPLLQTKEEAQRQRAVWATPRIRNNADCRV